MKGWSLTPLDEDSYLRGAPFVLEVKYPLDILIPSKRLVHGHQYATGSHYQMTVIVIDRTAR